MGVDIDHLILSIHIDLLYELKHAYVLTTTDTPGAVLSAPRTTDSNLCQAFTLLARLKIRLKDLETNIITMKGQISQISGEITLDWTFG